MSARFAPLLIAAVASLGSAAAAAQSAPSEIVVEGNRRFDSDAIRAHFHRPPGVRDFDAAALDAALKELYATGALEEVKIARAGARVIVTVVEAPVIDRLQFEGNKKLKDNELKKLIELKPGGPLIRSVLQNDVGRIAARYRQGGRYDVTVVPKTIARGNGVVDLVFEIDEGQKFGVRRIWFGGNHAFSAERLKAVIKTAESGWFAYLKTNDTYDPDRVEADRELLRAFYASRGYADARVVSAVATYDAAEQGIVLVFTIDEGNRYRFGAVEIESKVAGIDPAALRSTLALHIGDVYDGEAANKAAEDVALALARRGYPFATVQPRLRRQPAAGTIDVAFVVDDGPHRYVERIVVHGNKKTREEVIRRELDFAEGDAFNRTLIKRAERRLNALGLFKSVRITSEQGSAADRLVLSVDVEEERTGSFWVSGGYSTADGVLVDVSVSELNFLGRGQYVKATATIGQYAYGASLSGIEPYVLGSRAWIGGDLSFRESLSNPYQSYALTSYGATARLGAPLTDQLSVETRYSIVDQSLWLSPTVNASAVVKQTAVDGPLVTSAVGSTLRLSTLDNPRDPHDGVRAELRQDLAGLGGGADFFRSTADVRTYKTLSDDLTGMVRAQAGSIAPYGGQSLPFMAGFFGGPQLVRGFAPNGFGPRDLTLGTTMDNVGGNAYWATSAQLAAPIPGMPAEVPLKGAFFADAGSLWGYRGPTSFPALSQSMTVADSRKVRASVGASLIWDSPLGQLHVDYAVPLAKAPYDITQRLSFGTGPF